ncbi:porin family protein [Rufibacter latericius]|uniref:PorT family protein n=1 Tax=Rufibacter latericius TaxID=2487040 RepID=A0A3M9MNA9_9BACT|nr:porin family protein [Rufibacter latericius]RNI27026.1 PorT family protein [Rufibacter latericius]
MKKATFLTILLICSIQIIYAQTTLGIKSGVNITNVDYQNSSDIYKNKIRFYAGGLLQKEINGKVFGRAEAIYSLKGNTISIDNGNFKVKGIDEFHYLNIPLLVGFRPIEQLSILIGPELGYLVYARENFGNNPKSITDACNKLDVGASLGVSYKINSFLEAEARYSYGFTNIFSYTNHDSEGNVVAEVNDGKNRVFQTGLVYYFRK